MTMPASARHRVVVLLTAVALALALLLARTMVARADDPTAGSEPAPAGVVYTVRSGDTLWDIASAHVGPGDDVRVLVEDIRQGNHLDSSVIMPGQVLVIPIRG
jgi:Tfp pilus assembly protein FimV